MQEIEIKLADLFVDLLLRWRTIILCMLIGGIVMGGVSYVRSYRAVASQREIFQEERDKLLTAEEYRREQLTDEQVNNVDRVLNYERYLAGLQAYVDTSVLMQIDAEKIPRMELTFLVTASDAETSASIEKVYEDSITGSFIQWLLESGQNDLDSTALKELIALNRSSRGLLLGSDSFSVTIVHMTEDQCAQLAEQIISYVEIQQKRLQDLMGEHTIEVVNRSFVYVMDTNIMTSQKNVRFEIEEFISNIAQLKRSFSNEERMYYNFLSLGKAPANPVSIREMNSKNKIVHAESPSVSVKYVILGMILLAFVYVFYVFMQFVINSRLRASDDMKKMYGISQLALISSCTESKKIFSFVDHWIMKLCNRNKRIFSEKEATGLAAVAVKMQAKRDELDSVYCIGCDIKGKSMQVAEQIQKMLEKENISMPVLNNILYNQESMEKLQGAKGAFLLEKAGETLYEEISRELEILRRQGIKVLGAVIVE